MFSPSEYFVQMSKWGWKVFIKNRNFNINLQSQPSASGGFQPNHVWCRCRGRLRRRAWLDHEGKGQIWNPFTEWVKFYLTSHISFKICIDSTTGGVCSGDSGGPLVDPNGDQVSLQGDTSGCSQTLDSGPVWLLHRPWIESLGTTWCVTL